VSNGVTLYVLSTCVVYIQILKVHRITDVGHNVNGIFAKHTRTHGLLYKNRYNCTQSTPETVTNAVTTTYVNYLYIHILSGCVFIVL
jgi:hypothetical protein